MLYHFTEFPHIYKRTRWGRTLVNQYEVVADANTISARNLFVFYHNIKTVLTYDRLPLYVRRRINTIFQFYTEYFEFYKSSDKKWIVIVCVPSDDPIDLFINSVFLQNYGFDFIAPLHGTGWKTMLLSIPQPNRKKHTVAATVALARPPADRLTG
jgi:hypothetical protein